MQKWIDMNLWSLIKRMSKGIELIRSSIVTNRKKWDHFKY